MKRNQVIILSVIAAAILLFFIFYRNKEKFSTGYGTISALALNNRFRYCDPGNEAQGGSWSGGCFTPGYLTL